MKYTITIILAVAAICVARPLYLFAIDDCEMPPVQKAGFEDGDLIIGKHLGSQYAIHRQPITWTFDLCLNDPNLQYEITGSVPVEGNTVVWQGDKGIHYLYFQLVETASQEVIDEGTVAIKCVPRGQFRGVVWQ